jgi:squalene synthase HpnC
VARRAKAENFKVVSAVLPPGTAGHLRAFYGFARFVDELGDSYPGDRLAALDWAERETAAALDDPAGRHPLVARAAASVSDLGTDPAPLFDLIEANRLDQAKTSYATFEELLGYCSLSANPVGRLVLGAFGFFDEARLALSDRMCTGLQLVEHWQDVAEDARAGRVYLPAEDLARFGVQPSELAGPGPAGAALRSLMVFEAARARSFLDGGLPLVGLLPRRAGWAVAGFWAGGAAALDALAARGFDVLGGPRPAPRRRVAGLALRAAFRRPSPGQQR